MIDLNEMAIFAEVIASGSFTKAGKCLGLPKSTVSRKISLLEERLGVRLIQRTTRSLHLTDAGTAYFQQCSRIVSEAKEADLLAIQKQAIPSGLIKISAPPGFLFLSEYIAEFLAKFDQINIEINSDKRMVDLVTEGIDLAFRVGPLENSSLIARLLGVTRLVLCATPEYLKRYGVPETYNELKNHRLIQGIPWDIVDEAGLFSVDLPKRIITNENEMARRLTLKGFGISLLSELDCAADIRSGHLKPVLNDHPLPEKKIYLLYPSNQYVSLKVKKFIEFILDQWKFNPPW